MTNQRLCLATLCVALVFTLGTSTCEVNRWRGRPNIVFIIADDQGWRDFGFMGHPYIQTPTIDRLAREGAVFTGGVNSDSVCRPALRTLLTGLYPHQWDTRIDRLAQQGVTYEPWEEIHAFATLPRLLARRGYVSFQAGKYWEGTYAAAGFTDGMTDEYKPDGPLPGVVRNVGLSLIRNGGIDPVLDFIDANIDQPFFLWFAPMLPHVPHNPPQEYRDRYEGLGLPDSVVSYYAMTSWLDDGVTQLLEYINRRGLSDRTLVVFLTDNGWVQPTTPFPVGWRNGVGGAGGKLSPNEAGHRTPIIFHWPGRIRPGMSDRLVSTTDVWATILDYAHARTPRGRDAHSLRRHHKRTAIALSQPWWDLYVTKRWWAVWPVSGPACLYDRINDPEQMQNLALENSDLMATLRLAFRS